MDVDGLGRVRLEAVEAAEGNHNGRNLGQEFNLPDEAILASLAKVATPDGHLTFERFCAGLKIAMLRQEAASKKKKREMEDHIG